MANWFTGTPAQTKKFDLFQKDQSTALKSILQQALALLQQQQGGQNFAQQMAPYNPQQYQFDFQPIAQQSRDNFYQQTVPSLAERFTAMGGQGSSGFRQALGQAGAGLETNLAALGAQYGLQNAQFNRQLGQQESQFGRQLGQGQLQNLLSAGLTPRKETAYMPAQPGFLQSAASGIGQAAGYALPLAFL